MTKDGGTPPPGRTRGPPAAKLVRSTDGDEEAGVIPESEWKFFEGTEQRIGHLAAHRLENEAARARGEEPPWDPAELDRREAALIQEMDYPARVEQALTLDPTPEEARRLELHRRWVLATLFATHPDLAPLVEEIRARTAAFRPALNGRPVARETVERILVEEADAATREAAWQSLTPLAETLAAPTAELFRRRDLLARTLLETGYPEVAYHARGEDRAQVTAFLDELERVTRDAYTGILKEVADLLGTHEIEPWDLDYGLRRLELLADDVFPGEKALIAAREQARAWGLEPEPGAVRVEPADLPVESLVLPVDVPGDIRVLVRPASGHDTYRILFRAYGRALAHAHAGGRRRFLERDAAPMIEAAGALLESMTRDPVWVASVTGASEAAAREHLEARRRLRIVRLRRLAAGAAFESLVYTPAELDLHRFHNDVFEQMLREARRPEVRWPLDHGLAADPFHRGSVLLGEMIAAQTRSRLEAELGDPVRNPAVGPWLRERYFEPAARIPWAEKVEAALVGPLVFADLARELEVSFEGPRLGSAEEISDEAAAEYFEGIDLDDPGES